MKEPYKFQIKRPHIQINGPKTRLVADFTASGLPHQLWYELPSQFGFWFAADRSDGFVVGLLLQAMERGEDIVVEGTISAKLLHNLNNYYIPIVNLAYPHLKRIHITTSNLSHEKLPVSGVATGFSGGVDSFAAVFQHLKCEEIPEYRINHLLFHNVGSHAFGSPKDDRRLFEQRFQELLPIANELDIPFVPIDSNLGNVLPIRYDQVYSALNPSVLLVLQSCFSRYYFASGFKYKDCGIYQDKDMAYLDPLAIHLLSTESIEMIATGSQMSRVQKTDYISQLPLSYNYLNVCVDPDAKGKNCSVCFKCARTIMTLELLGKSELYSKVFDFKKFKKIRSRYLRSIIFAKPPSFEFEIGDYALLNSRELWVQFLRLRRAIFRI